METIKLSPFLQKWETRYLKQNLHMLKHQVVPL